MHDDYSPFAIYGYRRSRSRNFAKLPVKFPVSSENGQSRGGPSALLRQPRLGNYCEVVPPTRRVLNSTLSFKLESSAQPKAENLRSQLCQTLRPMSAFGRKAARVGHYDRFLFAEWNLSPITRPITTIAATKTIVKVPVSRAMGRPFSMLVPCAHSSYSPSARKLKNSNRHYPADEAIE